MQTNVYSLLNRDIRLQKLFIGIDLGSQQVGYFQHTLPLAKIFSDPLFLGI